MVCVCGKKSNAFVNRNIRLWLVEIPLLSDSHQQVCC
jgi:hypothetical protein